MCLLWSTVAAIGSCCRGVRHAVWPVSSRTLGSFRHANRLTRRGSDATNRPLASARRRGGAFRVQDLRAQSSGESPDEPWAPPAGPATGVDMARNRTEDGPIPHRSIIMHCRSLVQMSCLGECPWCQVGDAGSQDSREPQTEAVTTGSKQVERGRGAGKTRMEVVASGGRMWNRAVDSLSAVPTLAEQLAGTRERLRRRRRSGRKARLHLP